MAVIILLYYQKTIHAHEKKNQLKRERYWIETIPCININIPSRTNKEWYDTNKERLIAQQKVWNRNNPNKVLEYQTKYKNKSKGVYVDLNGETNEIDINDELNLIDIYDEIDSNFDEINKNILLNLIENNIITK